MKCDKCKIDHPMVFPSYYSVLGVMQSSGVDPRTKQIIRNVTPLPYTVTTVLCDKCNAEVLGIYLTRGILNGKQFKELLDTGSLKSEGGQ